MKPGLSARARTHGRAWFHSLSVNRSGSAAPAGFFCLLARPGSSRRAGASDVTVGSDQARVGGEGARLLPGCMFIQIYGPEQI